MIEIKIHNAYSQIVTTDPSLLREVGRILSYETPGAVFARMKNPYWDGRVKLMDSKGFFPTGLLPILAKYLKREEIPYKFTDTREKDYFPVKLSFMTSFQPRPYQIEARDLDRSRGVFVMGTGAGKSLTSALLINKHSVRTLVITPDTNLREQLHDSYAEWFGGKSVAKRIESKAEIIVCNIQSLTNKDKSLFESFGMIIIDEFHHSSSASYKKVNKYCKNAFFRFGFTGTFMRSDGTDMEMYGVLSQVIFRKTTSELIEEGYLVRPHITMIKYQIPKVKCNYREAYSLMVQDQEFHDLVYSLAHTKAFVENKQTVILVRMKEHAKHLVSRFLNDDQSAYLSGDDTIEHREYIKKKFMKKEIKLLVATSIFGEGVDIPVIDVLINARLQKTEIQTAQGIGRILRLSEGKDKAELFDFMIEGQKHLKAHSLERLESYRKEPAFLIKMS